MPYLTHSGELKIHYGFTNISQNLPWVYVKVLRPKKVWVTSDIKLVEIS